VLEAAVVARPDPRWGQVPVAFVVRRADARASELEMRDHRLARLARFKVPRALEFIDALPRNPSEKVAQGVALGSRSALIPRRRTARPPVCHRGIARLPHCAPAARDEIQVSHHET
jgi:AMP-binding enzyme C-terminal domain